MIYLSHFVLIKIFIFKLLNIIMNFLITILQFNFKDQFAKPYDSTFGVPSWFFWVAIVTIGYIAFRVYSSIKKDKK